MQAQSLFARLLPAALAGVLFLAGPVAAQNEYNLGNLEPGQVLLQLNASEQMEVEQDVLSARLEYSAQGRDKMALQDEVNRAMAAALELLEAADAEGVEHSTGQYYVYQFEAGQPERGDVEEPLWRAQQSIELKGSDNASLLDLAGQLQAAGLHMRGMHYSLSPERYGEVIDSLLAGALGRLQARADQAAEAMDKRSAALIEVSIHDNGPGYSPPYFRMEAMAVSAADMAPPVASPGRTQVQLTVSARALLSP